MSENRPSPDILALFVDGELPPEEMSRIAALVAQDSELRAYVARQQALRNRLDNAFASVIAEPVPERLLHAAQTAPISWQAKVGRQGSSWRTRAGEMLSWRVGIPAAAALSLGLIIGIVVGEPASQMPFVQNSQSGQMMAQGALSQALDEQLASNGNRNQTVRIGLSFRNKAGADCRTFAWGTQTSGVACHAGGAWNIAALASQQPEPNSQAAYQMAGSEMPEAIRNIVNAMIAGEPFDVAAEKQARADGWQGTSHH